MLEENQRTLISMSELIFFLNRDLKELKFINGNLRTQVNVKNDLLESNQEELKRLKLEKKELEEKCCKLREELKQKEMIIGISEEQLKKYRKEEKKREEISKALGDTIKEMKTKE